MKGPISFVRKSWQLNHNKTANTLERNLSRRDDGGSQRLLFIAYEKIHWHDVTVHLSFKTLKIFEFPKNHHVTQQCLVCT